MPAVMRMLETCVHVKDMDRSARFYEELFELRRMTSDERLCAFDAGEGTILLLFQEGGTQERVVTPGGVIPPHGGQGDLHLAFAISRDDLPKWDEALAQAGIAIESRVRWELGGVSLYIRDPDHHLVELATPGIWPSY